MRFRTALVAPAVLALFVASGASAQPKPPASAPAPSAKPSAAPAPAAKPSSTATDVAAQVQKAYVTINAYEADFTQQYVMKAFGQTKTSKGHVLFVKPGKMRWDYTEPKDNVVVSDGTTLWSYVASDKQARKMMVKDSQMPTALAFLTGKGDLGKEFNLELMDTKQLKFEGGYVLKATPKAATNLYNYVLFYVDGSTYHVRRVLIVDGQDNRNRFDFEKPVVNGKVDDSKFKWSPPAGVSVTTN
ncbi:MAG: outer membrane lipoprotein chaperone LolA [Deltaproteobacteria bacterium]|nr:outer membrane lipoprotein chaperone LolA [Deltaproteobacteria bacterium]